MSESEPLESELLILEKEKVRTMNEGSVTKQKMKRLITALPGGQIEVCGFSA
jgi:hypothetical protein